MKRQRQRKKKTIQKKNKAEERKTKTKETAKQKHWTKNKSRNILMFFFLMTISVLYDTCLMYTAKCDYIKYCDDKYARKSENLNKSI